MFLAYKDWKLRYKILFAAVAPFFIAAVLTLPFITSKSIQSSEEKAKSYNAEVSYSTALSIQKEMDSNLNEVLLLGKLIAASVSASKSGILDTEYLDRVMRYAFDQNHKYQHISLKMLTENQGYTKISELIRNNFPNKADSIKDWHTTTNGDYKLKVDFLSPSEMYINVVQKLAIDNSTSNLILTATIKNTGLETSLKSLSEYDISSMGIFDKNMTSLIRVRYDKNFIESTTWKNSAIEAITTGKDVSTDTYSDAFNNKNYNLYVPITFEHLNDTWVLYISYPLEKSKEQVIKNIKILLPVILLCLSLGIAVSLVTAKNISEPVTEISEALTKISEGHYSLSLPESYTTDEIGLMISSAHAFRQNTKDLAVAKVQAESANNAKTEFLANMSHELRTPMHAMLSYAKLGLEKVGETDPKLNKYFNNIMLSGERLLRLLNDLLDLSKLEAGKVDFAFRNNNIKLTIKKVLNEIRTLSQNKHLSIKINDFLEEDTFEFDDEKITQVIINIISNAIRFSPEGSTITIVLSDATMLAANTKPSDSSKTNASATLISITDQGVGIPESELTSIFDKFAQSSKTNKGAGGTGLGLSIATNIVEAHGGKIWAENNFPTGAVFNILIPKVVPKISEVRDVSEA